MTITLKIKSKTNGKGETLSEDDNVTLNRRVGSNQVNTLKIKIRQPPLCICNQINIDINLLLVGLQCWRIILDKDAIDGAENIYQKSSWL